MFSDESMFSVWVFVALVPWLGQITILRLAKQRMNLQETGTQQDPAVFIAHLGDMSHLSSVHLNLGYFCFF